MSAVGRVWKQLSVTRKLYFVVTLMSVLIAVELMVLVFAMDVLSSVRAFVGGEGAWSKAQKDAVISIQNYALTRNPIYYRDFHRYLEVHAGDREAKRGLRSVPPDIAMVRRGLHSGGVHPEDMDGIISLALRFRNIRYIDRAFEVWREADANIGKLMVAGDALHKNISGSGSIYSIREQLEVIERLNYDLTRLEDEFTFTLGEGSRWIERSLRNTLLFAVLFVEGLGIFLTISISRSISGGLKDIVRAAQRVGRGIFTERVRVKSQDELGELAMAINKMASDLQKSVGKTEQAEKANQLKSLFLANMSHEIRTPLGAIIGFVDLLRESGSSEDERKHYLEIIHKTATNLTSIINDILDISKVEAGYLEIEKSPILLNDFLLEIERVLDLRAKEKNISLIFDRRPSLPKYIYSDGMRLRQILMNVLGNAIKFTNEGHVKLTADMSGAYIKFLIEDTGIGVAPEQVSYLFQTFSQADSSVTRKFHGTGLGLALSRKLAQLLGGNVALVHSLPGKGSTFAVSVRYEQVVAGTEPAVAPESDINREALAKKISGKKILVVEDVEENRFLIQQVLVKRGAQIVEAKDGREGVELALSDGFDLILMDIQMPVLDGYSAVRELRARGYRTPIVALTAHAMAEDRNKCFSAGFNDYLSKPLHYSKLLSVVTHYL